MAPYICDMGHRIENLLHQLECLWAVPDAITDEPWVVRTVARGLAHSDPEIRELAISVAACSGLLVMLVTHVTQEPQPWLQRFCVLAVQDLQAQ